MWHFILFDMLTWITVNFFPAVTEIPKLTGTETLVTVLMSLLGLGGAQDRREVQGQGEMTRPDAMLHVHETACAVLGTENCFASVQSADPAPTFPSVVFYAVGQDTLTTLTEGAHQIATAIRFDVRDRISEGNRAPER